MPNESSGARLPDLSVLAQALRGVGYEVPDLSGLAEHLRGVGYEVHEPVGRRGLPGAGRAVPEDDELLTDPEAGRLLRVGVTKLFELQKQPDFPPPIWLGPRLKRHRRSELLRWLLSKVGRRPVPQL